MTRSMLVSLEGRTIQLKYEQQGKSRWHSGVVTKHVGYIGHDGKRVYYTSYYLEPGISSQEKLSIKLIDRIVQGMINPRDFQIYRDFLAKSDIIIGSSSENFAQFADNSDKIHGRKIKFLVVYE